MPKFYRILTNSLLVANTIQTQGNVVADDGGTFVPSDPAEQIAEYGKQLFEEYFPTPLEMRRMGYDVQDEPEDEGDVNQELELDDMTPEQIQAFCDKNEISPPQGLTRLRRLGYIRKQLALKEK